MSATLQKPLNWSYAKTASGNCVTGEATMRTKSLNSEKMEARVARFNKLQTYQRQNFEAHGIPPLGTRWSRLKRVTEILGLADNLFILKFHDTHRIRCPILDYARALA